MLARIIARVFADKIEERENWHANGYTVTRAVYAWHGGLRSFEVLEKNFTWSLN